ncbi:MAG: hypothetical protein A3G76_00270 [Acidobacteria bacterium RIFCSPLOWO2_12_FULL_65_11]|nr:MAG: hypothetical protein A3H95_13585 [Acidobacteria bacterium RIFCSPLOWO2_02_FULL_64_15]OFW28650.1 MAG: hypothetical protein A3G76_00270 [Acidobacteria bacterium RIFCSPLOWO2_12_FULL_65_11]
MQRCRAAIGPRTLRVAWIIEDRAIRFCTEAWLTLESDRLLAVPSATFATLRAATAWLLDVPSSCLRPAGQSVPAANERLRYHSFQRG